jgi:AAA domain, putative AbiEii toxin, Type IV TA system
MRDRTTPSLRIARLVISNFRTFHDPTDIVLSSGGVADEMPVFHGGNGTGKSNAIAAIELFFRGASYWLERRGDEHDDAIEIRWDTAHLGFQVSSRDWPPGARGRQSIDLQFESGPCLRLVLLPAGKSVLIRLEAVGPDGQAGPVLREGSESSKEQLAALSTLLLTPRGPESRPLLHMDARRREDPRVIEEAPGSPLSAMLLSRLLELSTSLDPGGTERWRAFVALVGRLETLRGREVHIVRTEIGADLRFEIRGRQILRYTELSSGEQQVLAMCAAVATSSAAIVAIEEPELSLDPDTQQLMREILREQVQSGLVDQIILESHVPLFDGPEVVRFARSSEGSTLVSRQPSGANDEVRVKARAAGAEEQWVTREGYTRLPVPMLDALDLRAGGYLWFLRSGPERRWQAWTAKELDEMLGLEGDEDPKE